MAAIGRWRRWLAPRATSSLPCQSAQPPPSTAHTSRSLAWEDAGDKKLIFKFCDGRVLPLWGEGEKEGCEEEPPGEEEEEGRGGGDHQEGGGGGERGEL